MISSAKAIKPIPDECRGVSKATVEAVLDNARSHPAFKKQKGLYRSPTGFPSWNAVLSRLVAHGQEMMATRLLIEDDHICNTVWRTSRNAVLNQAPVRFISPELCESFQKTPIPPLTEEMLGIYPSLIIVLPYGSLLGDEGENIDYLVVESNQGDDLWFTSEERKWLSLVRKSPIAPLKLTASPPGIFVSASHFYNDYTWAGYLNGDDAGRMSLEADVRDVIDRVGRIAISSLLAHLYEPELLTTEPARRSGRGFGACAATSLPVTWIGKNFRRHRATGSASAGGSDGSSGASRRPHWRRGHWHTVVCGEGRQERRMTWFRPVFVNGSV